MPSSSGGKLRLPAGCNKRLNELTPAGTGIAVEIDVFEGDGVSIGGAGAAVATLSKALTVRWLSQPLLCLVAQA